MTDNRTSPLSSLRDDTDARLPAAAYLRYESRADGWSAGRQAAFLSHLADNGVVEDAARVVGKSVGGGYALRRTARGYAFNLGWEAALIIARRVVSDRLMTAAIRGEQARWVREEGVTTYTRENSRLSLALLDRVNPATTLPEVMAVATRFDWFLALIEEGASGEDLWRYFFDDALPHSEREARERVRVALLLCAESADFEGSNEENGNTDEPPVEYKSMAGPPLRLPPSQFVNTFVLASPESPGAGNVIEVEVQNETYQSQEKLRFAVVPRIGEGIRLREPNGFWASFDVLDVWYQKAEFGDVWVPFLHIRKTADAAADADLDDREAVSFAI